MEIEEQYEEQFVGPKQFKRKNTKKWCKGKVGREHKPKVELAEKRYGYMYSWGKEIKCGDTPYFFLDKNKRCYHHVICENCGKELQYTPKTCPSTGLATGW